MKPLYWEGLALLTLSLGGFYLAYLYGRKTRKFLWREYIALLILPTVCIIYLATRFTYRVIVIYFVSALLGFLLEFSFGLAYHKTLNRRLWTYDSNRYSIRGYTSLLTLPAWGVGGVVFWYLGKVIEAM